LLTEIDDWCDTANKVWPGAESFVVVVEFLDSRTDLQARLENDTLAALVRRAKAILSAAN
jgi:hypothetical protein